MHHAENHENPSDTEGREKGTGKLTAQYGDRLLCVRYRYDEKRKKRFRIVELIVERKGTGIPVSGRMPGEQVRKTA